jgi:hypothetical protein
VNFFLICKVFGLLLMFVTANFFSLGIKFGILGPQVSATHLNLNSCN